MAFKDNLRKRRKELGLTLEEVAKHVGITRQTAQKYESGVVANIPSDKVEKLAEVLKTTPAYLMGWEDNQSPASPPELNARDHRDIAKYMEEMREKLASGEALMFDGEPLSEEDMDAILAAMQVGAEYVKKKNKEKYTPKKYRKG